MSLQVMKFGGTSVGSLDRIKAVAAYIAAQKRLGHAVVVVVSAMGDMTDELKAMAYQVSDRPSAREMDMLLTAGERISMSLLSMALHQVGVDSQSFTGSQSGILTDGVHGNARIVRILGDRLRACLAEDRVAVVAGFQGMNLETKNITTLGRGGSDLTGVALAAALGAERCDIFTDVAGVYAVDPRINPSARLIQQLHWDEMLALAEAGAGVLHARAAEYALEKRIIMRIASSFDFSLPGTLIGDFPAADSGELIGIAWRRASDQLLPEDIAQAFEEPARITILGPTVAEVRERIGGGSGGLTSRFAWVNEDPSERVPACLLYTESRLADSLVRELHDLLVKSH